MEAGLIIACSVNELDQHRRCPVRCCNWTDDPIIINSGAVIGTFQPLHDPANEIETPPIPITYPVPLNIALAQTQAMPELQPHVPSLFDEAHDVCKTFNGKLMVANLHNQYADVFSKDETDIGLTHRTTHAIPTIPGAPINRHNSRRLGHEKEAKVERQVCKLREQGLIEPGDGAWSSPVVLVKNKGNIWRFCVDYRKLKPSRVKMPTPSLV